MTDPKGPPRDERNTPRDNSPRKEDPSTPWLPKPVCEGFKRSSTKVRGRIGEPSDRVTGYSLGRTWYCSLLAGHDGECSFDR